MTNPDPQDTRDIRDTPDSLGEALEQTTPDLEDQGDIAADDAGATALAERVTKSAAIQGESQDP